MAGFVASGATFTFCNVRATATRVAVEPPTAELVDMTPDIAPAATRILVPTGDRSGGSIDVDFISSVNGTDPDTAIGKVGDLLFAANGISVSKRVVCESASREAATGDLVRGTFRFRLTDYTATDSLAGTGF